MQDRWTAAVTPKAAQIESMIDSVIAMLPEKFQKEIIPIIDANITRFLAAIPSDYAGELRGIAAATKVDIGKIFLFNIAYELEGMCTSIVAQDSNGNVFHARNLDFGLFLGW